MSERTWFSMTSAEDMAYAAGVADERARYAALVAALTDEDEIAHAEAVSTDLGGEFFGLGRCAYCDKPWPCHTQSAIDRALALLR